MVTKIEEWECDICNRRFTSQEQAMLCEEKGLAPDYPVGLLFQNYPFYKEITFAVAGTKKDRHYQYISAWACRDNGYGDDLGDRKCGHPHSKLCSPPLLTDEPHFKRMVAWLKEQGITPMCFDGEGNIVPLKE